MSATDMEKKLKRKRVCSAIYGVIITLLIEAIVLYVQYTALYERDYEVWMWPIIWLGHSILYFIFDQICYPTKSQKQYFEGMYIVLICIWGYLGRWALISIVFYSPINEFGLTYFSHVLWRLVLLISHYILEKEEIRRKPMPGKYEGKIISDFQSKVGRYGGRTMRIKMIALVVIIIIALMFELMSYFFWRGESVIYSLGKP